MCVLYEPWIQWLFVAGAPLKGGHYRTDIISGVGHSCAASVMYDSVQWLGHQHCTIALSGQQQPC
jgi:hypothetical protein